jgi:hypothetical protein
VIALTTRADRAGRASDEELTATAEAAAREAVPFTAEDGAAVLDAPLGTICGFPDEVSTIR